MSLQLHNKWLLSVLPSHEDRASHQNYIPQWATERGRNYDNYQKGLITAIEHLKECFPQAGILLLSVGDRDYKNENGELRTMPGVKNLIRYQQNIAAESNIAFWNMFEAMGGDGSMAKLVHAKPSMANYDYTHINFRGGKHLAGPF